MRSQTKETMWEETELRGLAKATRFALAICLILLGAFFVFYPEAQVSQSWIGWSVSMGLVLVGLYDLVLVFRQRLFWNETGIFVRGVFRNGALRKWQDLEALSDSMQHRATVLTFKKYRRVKLYWSYQAYREIRDIAEGKLSNNA